MRRSLERALHDGLQQQLVALAGSIQLAREALERDPVAAAQILDDMAEELQRALEQAARLAHRIYPPLLEVGGLAAALRAAALATGVTTEINVATDLQLPPEVAGAVYFCWLDVLEVAGTGGWASVVVSVGDGTVGFELGGEALSSLSDATIAGLGDRVEAIGGRIRAESSPDGQATLRGRLPLSR